MAFFQPLGSRYPAALGLLKAEALLPPAATPQDYVWETYNDGVGEEELLSTKSCVVWTQGGLVRRFARFDSEGLTINQALLTWFRSGALAAQSLSTTDTANTFSNGIALERNAADASAHGQKTSSHTRALVVLLKHHAHIYLLDGPSHIVSLPFEVERAFATPRGLILLRKASNNEILAPTPLPPAVPQNSFLNSQSHLVSPQISRHHQTLPERRKSSVLGFRPPTSLSDLVIPSSPTLEDNLPRIFTLNDPLSEVGLVVERHVSSYEGGYATDADLESIGKDEVVLYVSHAGELGRSAHGSQPLLLIVTFNHIEAKYTIWHAMYIDARATGSSENPPKKASPIGKSKRRSSRATRLSTGVNTPRLRGADTFGKDQLQTSFGGQPGTKSQQSFSKTPDPSSQTAQAETDLDATVESNFNLHDDFGTTTRRTSSVLARAELSSQEQHTFSDLARNPVGSNTSHGLPGRKTGSFGSYTDRASFGQSRTSGRFSTGSLSRLEDVDETMQLDFLDDETLEDFLAEAANPYETESLQASLEGLRKELLIFKVASVPVHQGYREGSSSIPPPRSVEDVKIFTFAAGSERIDPDDTPRKLSLFIVNRPAQTMSEICVKVQSRTLKYPANNGHNEEVRVLLPSKDIGLRNTYQTVDAAVITDGNASRLAILKSNSLKRFTVLLVLSPAHKGLGLEFWSPLTKDEENDYCLAVANPGSLIENTPESQPLHIDQAGTLGKLDLIDYRKLHNCFKFTIRPRNQYIVKILNACDFILAQHGLAAALSTATWLRLRHHDDENEWSALITSLFSIIVFLGDVNDLQSASRKSDAQATSKGFDGKAVPTKQYLRANQSNGAWNWVFKDNAHIPNVAEATASDELLIKCLERAKSLFTVKAHSVHLRGVDVDLTAKQKQETIHHLVVTLHLLRELELLDTYSQESTNSILWTLRPVLAQIFLWQKLVPPGALCHAYDFRSKDFHEVKFNHNLVFSNRIPLMSDQTSIFQSARSFMGEEDFSLVRIKEALINQSKASVPQLDVSRILGFSAAPEPNDSDSQDSIQNQERMPEGIAVTTRAEAINYEKDHPTISSKAALSFPAVKYSASFDTLTKQLHRQDKRKIEAHRLLDPLRVAVAQIEPASNTSESSFLESQKVLAQRVYKRTMAIPSGQAVINFCSYQPMLTERINVTSFNTSCNMQPSNNTVNADKSNFTEEKVFWAFFHAGVNAGLRIDRNSSGIDTSWLVLNKPNELGNRHAGLLLALGLNGHLKSVAKWLAFKYLTPKHTMTSVGLLLGMSASHLGTMNTMVTRLLSVHITRLLPPGAAELNLSPLTQTAGIMGVGLLYYNSQHRRMSEAMLSEIEHVDSDDSSGPISTFRDESYRLSAGFALGLINVGKANQLHSLRDLRIVERLLLLATGTKEIKTMHILDQASAGATMALAFIFMKSNDETLAKRIDVPSTVQQFDYVRPDILLLRTVAKNVIMWDGIEPTESWILRNIPPAFKKRTLEESLGAVFHERSFFESKNIPFYNILAGLCWSIGLRFAGSGSTVARDLLMRILKNTDTYASHLSFNYERNLTRNTLTRIDYIIALSMATIMAGTGDLDTFRILRIFHSRTDDIITFGLHQAVHTAIGVLFMGGGRYTFSNSNLAIASLMCSFYPIFPKDVLDNRAHLQALRHLWVFAAEARALIPRDIETGDPLIVPITVILKDGSQQDFEAPCLLPGLDTISAVYTTTVDYLTITLDFANNPEQLAAFRKDQCIYLRRKSILSKHLTTFASTLATLNESSLDNTTVNVDHFDWIWSLKCLKDLCISRPDALDILPLDIGNEDSDASNAGETNSKLPVQTLLDMRTTALDDALVLRADVESDKRERLESLKTLFAWAQQQRKRGRKVEWLKEEWVHRLRAAVVARGIRESKEKEEKIAEAETMAVDSTI